MNMLCIIDYASTDSADQRQLLSEFNSAIGVKSLIAKQTLIETWGRLNCNDKSEGIIGILGITTFSPAPHQSIIKVQSKVNSCLNDIIS